MAPHPYFHRAGRLLAIAVAGAALAAPASSTAAPLENTVFDRPATAVGWPRDTDVPPKRMEDLTEAEVLRRAAKAHLARSPATPTSPVSIARSSAPPARCRSQRSPAWRSSPAGAHARRCDVVHLVVGVDRATAAPWHQHVAADDVNSAVEIAIARARNSAIDLVIAAVLGPYSSVLPQQIDKET